MASGGSQQPGIQQILATWGISKLADKLESQKSKVAARAIDTQES